MIFNLIKRKMKIGIAAENKPAEKRVAMLPQQVRGLSRRHKVLVEKGAGLGIGIGDAEYKAAGAKVVEKDKVYQADVVISINAPNEGELKLMKPRGTVMCMLHLKARPRLARLLKKYQINAIALEELKDVFGERMVEALHDTGYLGMNKGFELWEGEPEKATVKIMGYGHVAWGAIQAAARKFAKVIVLNKRDINEMEKHMRGTDILVNALNWPYELRGKVILVKRRMLRLLNKKAVIVDLVSNPAGQSPIETCHPTTLNDIYYKTDGIIHAACWGWPGLDPVNISNRYSIQILPIVRQLAESGFKKLPDYIKNALVEVEE